MIQDKVAAKGAPVKAKSKTKARQSETTDIARLMLDSIGHGVVLFSGKGLCEMHNRVLHDLLELENQLDLAEMPLEEFLTHHRDRGLFSSAHLREHLDLFQLARPFQFDCKLPSDRVLSAQVRPIRGGGHVVTFTDVTEARRAASALAVAQADAEIAERRAIEVLEDERARQREANLLAMLDEWLQSCKSLDELYTILTTFMKKVLPGTSGQLFTYSNSRDVLEKACVWNWSAEQNHVAPDSCWALRRGRAYHFDPEGLCFVCDHVTEAHTDQESQNNRYLCVPIVAHGDTVGLLHIEFDPQKANPEVIDAAAFSIRCGEHISMAIANVKLRDELQHQSTRDPLTGLYNRRHFMDTLARELSNTASKQGNFALLSVDADRFKNFNDDHGHDAGDVVLQAIADKMLTLDAEGSTVCRIGGEEFSILIPACDRTKASQLAEDLRHSISEMRVKYFGGSLPKVTISAGIAVYPTHGTQAQDLVKAADEALYAAKAAGRDQWKVAEGDGMIAF